MAPLPSKLPSQPLRQPANQSLHQPALSVPGPPSLPLVGSTLSLLEFVKDSVGYTHKLFNTYGHIVALAPGRKTRLYSPRENCPGTVFVCGPDLTREVTTQHNIYQ